MTEYMELNPARKWAFMQRYYETATKFFDAHDNIVSDEEIDACVSRFKEKPRAKYRRQYFLTDWQFKFDPHDRGIQQEYFAPGYDDSQWEAVKTPHSYRYIPEHPLQFGKLDCNLVKTDALWQATYDVWYRTRLPLEALNEHETAYLSFESVNLITNVWLNDNPIMLDHVGLFPFKMDVGDELQRRTTKEASIAVRARDIVTNHPNFYYNGWQFAYRNSPYTHGSKTEDWVDQADAGIAGEAELVVVNQNHLENVFITTQAIGEEDSSLVGQIILRNASKERFHGRVRIEISEWLPKESDPVKTVTQTVQILPLNEAHLDMDFKLEKAQLWNADTPNLYLAHVVLEDAAGQPIDDLYETFGVRTIKIVGSSLYLNNERFVPRGTHDVAVYQGESDICPSDHIIVKDILLHKKLGANCSRWPSDKSMHFKRLADYCDQLGFMLSWVGYLQIWTIHPELEMLAGRDVKTLVRSLRNCPSLIIWEMGDEILMYEHNFRRLQWYEKIYQLVIAEDPSRPIIPGGDYCRDLYELITHRNRSEGNLAVARAKVLEDYPVYDHDQLVWDYHHCPQGKPLLPFLDSLRNAFAGHKPAVFTEFGIYGMPDLKKVIDVYGKFRWAASPLFGVDMVAYADDFYGRQIGAEDWRETQACQAILLNTIIGRLRSYPEEFAAYYLVTMFDAWTFNWGIVDVHGDPKLAYWVAQSCYQPLFVSGLHGNTTLKSGEQISITVSNYAHAMINASLQVKVLDNDQRVLYEKTFSGLDFPGSMAVSTVAQIDTSGLDAGLYSIEYQLSTKGEDLAARSIELFFVE